MFFPNYVVKIYEIEKIQGQTKYFRVNEWNKYPDSQTQRPFISNDENIKT